MRIKFNNTFLLFLKKFNIPTDLVFDYDLPQEIREMFLHNIVSNEHGIGFENIWIPRLIGEINEQSFHEDYENHFHVDWISDFSTEEEIFKIGIKATVDLAKRFEEMHLNNINLTYSFQTAEMGKAQSIAAGIEDDDHFLSDRISFHTTREGQFVVSDELFSNPYQAFLVIDV